MSRRDDDLDEEIRAHLAMARRDRMERGEPADAAEAAARREFGNPTLVKETTREVWGWGSVEKLSQDLRYGLRMLRRSPGFAAVAVLSLALGIGANTAIFSLIHAIILRSLPVERPEDLVEVLVNRGRGRGNAFSWQTYSYLRDHNQTLTDLLASHRDRLYISGDGLETQYAEGQYVSGNYFPMLGVRPAMGRLIAPQDDIVGAAAPVAVVSSAYWKNRLGLDPEVIGRKITVENTPVTIVGVAPPVFFGTQVGWAEDVYVPLALERVIRGARTYTKDGGYKWLQLMGRRRPGVSMKQVFADLSVAHRRTLERDAADFHHSEVLTWRLEVEPGGAGLARMRDEFAKPLYVLMAIVGILLLIACANVAGMLLARGAARQREIALRVSLGAGRFRLLRQLLTESLLLSVTASALGIVLAYAGSGALARAMAVARARLELEVRPEWPVLLFTAAVALATGLLFGTIPALRVVRGGSLAPATRDAARGGETRSRRLFGRGLIVVQVAFSVVLLTGAAIFMRNFERLAHRDLGIRRDGVLMIALDPSHSGYDDGQLADAYRQLLGRFEQIPGVRSASICWVPPVAGGGSDGTATVEGTPVSLYSRKNWVAPRYFETVGMPLLAGRDFTMADRTGSAKVAVINQTLERKAFGSANPLGRRLGFKPFPDTYEVIGVVGDSAYMSIREAPEATAYLSTFQGRPASQFVVRASVLPAQIAPAARREIQATTRGVLIGKITTLADYIDSAIVNERLVATLSSLFGALGALLAAIGLYGLLAYSVARRTNEIGIRMALGANRMDVIRMVVGEAALTVAAGLAVGIPVALAGGKAAGRIFGDLPPEGAPIAIFGAVAMFAVAAVAAYVPARRAVRVAPVEALRYE